MRNITFALLLTALFALFFASAAAAQYEVSDKSTIGFKACIFKPVSSALSDVKSAWFGPMIDWNVRFDKFDRPNLVVSTGWFGESATVNYKTTEATFAPLTATALRYFGDQDNGWYTGVGLGLYWAKFKGVVNTWDDEWNGVLPGLNLVAGRQQGAWFAELSMSKISKLSAADGNIDFSAWGLSVGSHFSF